MNPTSVPTPTARCQFGIGRCDITPPVGIYHRFWGAAKHDVATGVHRPLTATVLLLKPLEADSAEQPHVLIAIDHCLFRQQEMDELLFETAKLIGIDVENIVFLFSHTHSAGNHVRDRAHLPGGDLIGPYLDSLPEKIATAFLTASTSLQPATMTFAKSHCNMGQHRDFWDEAREHFVCGFNPGNQRSYPVKVVRVTDQANEILATIVNYPCHPTTLAWDNTLISPDYIGSLREELEFESEALCFFMLAPCGDIGPKDGFRGDTAVADRNGRQVAFSALSALESMPTAGHDYGYLGPVISGASLGDWTWQPLSEPRQKTTSLFRHEFQNCELAYRSDLPTEEELQNDLQQLLEQEKSATENNDLDEARRLRALAERKRRSLERSSLLPQGEPFSFPIRCWQMGDLIWIVVEGEPYFDLQEKLEARFPDKTLIVSVLANGSNSSYLPREEDYAQESLYQQSIAILAPGSLETLIEVVASQIELWNCS
jgi:hypothetical protein